MGVVAAAVASTGSYGVLVTLGAALLAALTLLRKSLPEAVRRPRRGSSIQGCTPCGNSTAVVLGTLWPGSPWGL
ncbi:hypothetical protein DB31_3456 [Hyalangium minutum]|uniref:Uncharacterized protein n=1 Tax=Hyalangium minutum TaxID=394096 RepID=A0A085WUG3_9BACT|nr:hypothetical protein DB31_3456 [Hyalangium minutum]